jgi:hypothetical protein
MQLLLKRPKRIQRSVGPVVKIPRPNYNPDADVRSDWRLLGCLSDDELFNGSSVARAIKAPHNKTWLELHGLRAESICEEYCAILDDYRDDKISYIERLAKMSNLGRL